MFIESRIRERERERKKNLVMALRISIEGKASDLYDNFLDHFIVLVHPRISLKNKYYVLKHRSKVLVLS